MPQMQTLYQQSKQSDEFVGNTYICEIVWLILQNCAWICLLSCQRFSVTNVDGAFLGAACKLNLWVTHKFVGSKAL